MANRPATTGPPATANNKPEQASGRHRRRDNLAIMGRDAGQIVLGAVVMFFIAGLIEGIFRQTVQSIHHHRFKMLPVLRQKLKGEIGADDVWRNRFA